MAAHDHGYFPGRGKGPFIQACTHEIWFEYAQHEVRLGVSHTQVVALEGSADALSHWHLAQVYRYRVDKLLQDKSATVVNIGREFVHMSPLL